MELHCVRYETCAVAAPYIGHQFAKQPSDRPTSQGFFDSTTQSLSIAAQQHNAETAIIQYQPSKATAHTQPQTTSIPEWYDYYSLPLTPVTTCAAGLIAALQAPLSVQLHPSSSKQHPSA